MWADWGHVAQVMDPFSHTHLQGNRAVLAMRNRVRFHWGLFKLPDGDHPLYPDPRKVPGGGWLNKSNSTVRSGTQHKQAQKYWRR